MDKTPSSYYSIANVRQLEHYAIAQQGIAEYELMTTAGQAAFDCLLAHWPQVQTIVVLCGGGNNGGDGLVLARLAKLKGIKTIVLTTVTPAQLKGAAAKAFQDAIDAHVLIQPYQAKLLSQADVLVDALLGIGVKGDVREDMASILQSVNQSGKSVLAIDNPSGLDCDTGCVLGTALKANVTITFIAKKIGLFLNEAYDYTGEVECHNLNISSEGFSQLTPQAYEIALENLIHLLPKRTRTAHKGLYGHVLCIGGDYGFAGSIRMAAEAALRTGAGLVSVATRPEHVSGYIGDIPEVMCHGIVKTQDIQPLIDRATVIAIGPGLGQGEWGKALLDVVMKSDKAKVIDADALNLLAQNPKPCVNSILTPHPGEAARLLASDTKSIQSDRLQAIQSLHKRYQANIVLKGAGTLVQTSDGILLSPIANPAMASGGMGDVLTGIIAGCLAQGVSVNQSAQLGVSLHAQAAMLAAQAGERGTLAMDLIPYLHHLVNENS